MNITLPFTDEVIKQLKCGDRITISGTVYTARDAAHKRMIEKLSNGEDLPFDPKGQIIYYAGPCPAKPGHVIGSCGPTTSGRMDAYTPALLDLGLKAMIGKGQRSPEVINAMVRNNCIYLGAIGGAGALYSKCITSMEVIAYEDLGPESVKKLTVENMPLTVIIDSYGNNLYDNKIKNGGI
jgi:fumarate hydratase subunit beta